MILNRTDDEDGLRLPSSTTREYAPSPAFQSLIICAGLFGYDGIILEATESGQVVSVMLF